jgi:hypothetical protein
VATTTPPGVITLGAASVTTILQIATPSTQDITLVDWGVSFNGAAPAQAVQCEIFGTTVAATSMNSLTPTGLDASGVNRASLCVGGTGATAYYKSGQSEGTVANYRQFDLQLVDPAVGYFKQWPLGFQPYAALSTYVRIRVTAPAAVGVYGFVSWTE